MQDGRPLEPSLTATSTLQSSNPNVIRLAFETDIEAIIEVETSSFPDVYVDADELAYRRRRELGEGYPCYKVLAASSRFNDQPAIYGLAILESYLRSPINYQCTRTGEQITLPANRPPDRKPAYDLLMAATRADPALLDEEFLFISEICVHPNEREKGNGTRLMRHIMDIADGLAMSIIVLAEGLVSEAAQQWAVIEAEEISADEMAVLREIERKSTVPFYEDKLGFRRRAHFFWGRRGFTIPRIFHVMQYPAKSVR
ncbi:hypothetical protein F5Y19DRAFT_263610 [Xylariaceae sp. FL1651]|nr:hypothetical protein F5Y19DRAFT_263610 [Xylariaceae sp. FL1651]